MNDRKQVFHFAQRTKSHTEIERILLLLKIYDDANVVPFLSF